MDPTADQSTVSVILPLYNGERFIRASSASVLGQTFSDFELLIIDDGSTDNSLAHVPDDPRIRVFRRRNRGVAATRNFGLERACGEFIAFIDQDDCWHPDKLQLQLQAFAHDPDLGYVLTMMQNRLQGDTQKPVWLKEEQVEKEQIGLLPSSLLARREVFSVIGDFDQSLTNASDLDWFIRADQAGIKRTILKTVLVVRGIHEANASHAKKLSKRETFMILKRQIEARKQEGTREK